MAASFPSSNNCTLISLRNRRSSCPALSKELAQNPGRTFQARFPKNPNFEWSDRRMKMVRVQPSHRQSSPDLLWFPRTSPSACPHVSRSPRFLVKPLFHLSQPGLASVACKHRTRTDTTLGRKRLKYILSKFCFYYVLIP